MSRLNNVICYEKYLPVLTSTEVDALLASRPSLLQLQDWERRLNNRRARLRSVFSRAYSKQNMIYGKGK